MSRNIEIKARIADRVGLEAQVAEMADRGPTRISQDDTFFRCATGRLKLREFDTGLGELIFYQRENGSGPQTSFYLRSATSEPRLLRQSLSLAYGEVGRVVKQRTLYWVGRTRIHLDQVTHLGDFLELEVVLADDDSIERGGAQASDLMATLGIASADLVDCAYVDLLPRNETAPDAIYIR